MTSQFEKITNFIRETFNNQEIIPLHEPRFDKRDEELVLAAIKSTFVSSVGKFVTDFEEKIKNYVGSKFSVATNTGTSALHLALLAVGVEPGDEVITQPLSFVATANAIAYTGAQPIFLDIDEKTLSLSAQKLFDFLKKHTYQKTINNQTVTFNKYTNRKISACVVVHVFGFPAEIDEIVKICKQYNLAIIEDAAESLGSLYKNKYTGTFGDTGVFSFNGNKIITTGAGGMLVTNNIDLAEKARHLSTQAKLPHPWQYIHDKIGYNYRMPNLNAALGLAQLDKLNHYIERKRALAERYKKFFLQFENIKFFNEPPNSRANYWLNTIIFDDLETSEEFIKFALKKQIFVRPAWRLLNTLPMYKNNFSFDLSTAKILVPKIVNLPSSVI